jgi:preprotein translocase subunit SecA
MVNGHLNDENLMKAFSFLKKPPENDLTFMRVEDIDWTQVNIDYDTLDEIELSYEGLQNSDGKLYLKDRIQQCHQFIPLLCSQFSDTRVIAFDLIKQLKDSGQCKGCLIDLFDENFTFLVENATSKDDLNHEWLMFLELMLNESISHNRKIDFSLVKCLMIKAEESDDLFNLLSGYFLSLPPVCANLAPLLVEYFDGSINAGVPSVLWDALAFAAIRYLDFKESFSICRSMIEVGGIYLLDNEPFRQALLQKKPVHVSNESFMACDEFAEYCLRKILESDESDEPHEFDSPRLHFLIKLTNQLNEYFDEPLLEDCFDDFQSLFCKYGSSKRPENSEDSLSEELLLAILNLASFDSEKKILPVVRDSLVTYIRDESPLLIMFVTNLDNDRIQLESEGGEFPPHLTEILNMVSEAGFDLFHDTLGSRNIEIDIRNDASSPESSTVIDDNPKPFNLGELYESYKQMHAENRGSDLPAWEYDDFERLSDSLGFDQSQLPQIQIILQKLNQVHLSFDILEQELFPILDVVEEGNKLDLFFFYLFYKQLLLKSNLVFSSDDFSRIVIKFYGLPEKLRELFYQLDLRTISSDSSLRLYFDDAVDHCDIYGNALLGRDENFERTKIILTTLPPSDWLFTLHRLSCFDGEGDTALSQNERSFDELLNLMKTGSESEPPELSRDLEAHLRNQYQALKTEMAKLVSIQDENVIKAWFAKFRRDHPNKSPNISQGEVLSNECKTELLARVIHAMSVNQSIQVRDAQILSVLLMLNADNKGRLAEVLTGEGKTATIAIFAGMKALCGERVNIITSSKILAFDAINKNSSFYELLNISVWNNYLYSDDYTQEGTCYNSDIVYGDHTKFEADILADDFYGQGIRNNRGFGVAIVDEVDSMLIDMHDQSTRLLGQNPGMRDLEPAFALIYHLVRADMSSILRLEEEDYKIQEPDESFIRNDFLNGVFFCLKKRFPDVFSEKTLEEILESAESSLKEAYKDCSKEEAEFLTSMYRSPYGKLAMLSYFLAIPIELYDSIDSTVELNQEWSKYSDWLSSINEKPSKTSCCQFLLTKESFFQLVKQDTSILEDELVKKIKNFLVKSDNQADPPLASTDKDKLEKVLVPNHLYDYFVEELPYLIKSARYAISSCSENEEYAISEKDKHNNVILPIDAMHTGVVQQNMQWDKGQHIFLQMAKKCRLSAENITTNVLSNLNFFKLYKNKIFGFTGTLGLASQRDFLQKKEGVDGSCSSGLYELDTLRVPSYKPVQRTRLPDLFLFDKQAWLEQVVQNTLLETRKARPVLIICRSVKAVDEIIAEIKKKNPSARIRRYSRDDIDDESKALDTPLEPGEIVVATNLAGRGTDIKLNDAAIKRGGLHVITSFFPASIRVQQQAEGRASRNGQPGSCQMIADASLAMSELSQVCPEFKLEHGDANEFILWRKEAEKKLLSMASTRVVWIEFENSLFSEFCQVLKNLGLYEPAERLQPEQRLRRSSLEERWGFYYNKFRNEVMSDSHLDQDEKIAEIKQRLQEKFDQEFKGDENVSRFKQTEFVKNPYHWMVCASDLLSSDDGIDQAIDCYTKAIQLDKNFASMAYYYRGFLKFKKNDLQGGKQDLQTAKRLLQNVQENALSMTLMSVDSNQEAPSSDFAAQQHWKMNLIAKYLESIDQALEKADQLGEDIEVKLERFQDAFQADKGSFFYEGCEYQSQGAFGFFSLQAAPVPWYNIAAVVGLGLLQVAGGLVTMAFHPGIGIGLIMEGASDFQTAIEAAVSGEFTWANYFKSKMISVAITLAVSAIGFVGAKLASGLGKSFSVVKNAFNSTKGFFKSAAARVSKLAEKLSSRLKVAAEKFKNVFKTSTTSGLAQKTSSHAAARVATAPMVKKQLISSFRRSTIKVGARHLKNEVTANAATYLLDKGLNRFFADKIEDEIYKLVKGQLETSFRNAIKEQGSLHVMLKQFIPRSSNPAGLSPIKLSEIHAKMHEYALFSISDIQAPFHAMMSQASANILSGILKALPSTLATIPGKSAKRVRQVAEVANGAIVLAKITENINLILSNLKFSDQFLSDLSNQMKIISESNYLDPALQADQQALFNIEGMIDQWADLIAKNFSATYKQNFLSPMLRRVNARTVNRAMNASREKLQSELLDVKNMHRNRRLCRDVPASAVTPSSSRVLDSDLQMRANQIRQEGAPLSVDDFAPIISYVNQVKGGLHGISVFVGQGDAMTHYGDFGRARDGQLVIHYIPSDQGGSGIGHFRLLKQRENSRGYDFVGDLPQAMEGKNNCLVSCVAHYVSNDRAESPNLQDVRHGIALKLEAISANQTQLRRYKKACHFSNQLKSQGRHNDCFSGGALHTPGFDKVSNKYREDIADKKLKQADQIKTIFNVHDGDWGKTRDGINSLGKLDIQGRLSSLGIDVPASKVLRDKPTSIDQSKPSGNHELLQTSEFPRWMAYDLCYQQNNNSHASSMTYLDLFFDHRRPTENVMFFSDGQISGHAGALHRNKIGTQYSGPVTAGQPAYHDQAREIAFKSSSPMDAFEKLTIFSIHATPRLRHLADHESKVQAMIAESDRNNKPRQQLFNTHGEDLFSPGGAENTFTRNQLEVDRLKLICNKLTGVDGQSRGDFSPIQSRRFKFFQDQEKAINQLLDNKAHPREFLKLSGQQIPKFLEVVDEPALKRRRAE